MSRATSPLRSALPVGGTACGVAQPTSAASFFSTSASASTTSVLARGSLPSSELIGIDKLIASTTRAPAPPNDLRVSSCAHTPPYRPPEAPITASGLAVTAPSPYGRDNQSIAFFTTAG